MSPADSSSRNGRVLATSTRWEAAAPPAVSVVVATWNRSGYLGELHAALVAQSMSKDRFEVVVVDNGSSDDTAAVLSAIAASSPLRMAVVRLEANRGPAGGRNAGAGYCRAPLLAVTDDDCLPTPTWLTGIVAAFTDTDVVLVQGRVDPDPSRYADAGSWDHTVSIPWPTPFFETCNIAYRTASFRAVGGFDEDDPLLRPRSGRAFGEDTLLGTTLVVAHGRREFAGEAVVHHRLVPGSFRNQRRDQRHIEGMPGLARRSPVVADALRGGVFLSRATMRFDLGLVGVVAALVSRRPWALVLVAPWIQHRWPHAVARSRGRGTVASLRILGEYSVLDATTLVALLRGSVRHRRPVL